MQNQALLSLDAAGFHAAVESHPHFACILHSGLTDADTLLLGRLRAMGEDAWTWAELDLRQAAEIGTMLGLAGSDPWLLLMRERVGLYRDLLSARPPEDMRPLLDRAARLDMDAVQAEIAQRRQARDTVFARRACPTVWRSGA